MLQRFLTFIREQHLMDKTDRLLLAVSGGVDSMVMAHLCHQAGFQIAVAHVNYHLRGEESNLDQILVQKWCADRQVPFFLHDVQEQEYQSKESIQMVARSIRYQFFKELSADFDWVATAHNANDNVETVLLNLTKGTGIHGLLGIALKRGHLVRPLLFATREEIVAYAKGEGVIWREDLSNQKSDYQRNWLRNEVVPRLRHINPNLEHTFESTVRRMKGVAHFVDEELENIKSRVEQQHDLEILDLEWFAEDLKSEMLLFEFIKAYGFTYADARDLSGAILRNESGKIFYTVSHEINLDRSVLLIRKNQEEHQLHTLIPEQMGQYAVGNSTVRVSTVMGNDFPMNCPKNVAYFDRELIRFPITVRHWQQGDHFRPLGMQGKKKVSDYMIDNKIPLTLKKDLLVMESAGAICWLVGHRMDDRFKITSDTVQMLKIEVAN